MAVGCERVRIRGVFRLSTSGVRGSRFLARHRYREGGV